MNLVLSLGPVLTCRRWVSLELRYGTCGFLAPKAEKTSPRALSDLLMLHASFCRCPSTCDLFSRSLHTKLCYRCRTFVSSRHLFPSDDIIWLQRKIKTCIDPSSNTKVFIRPRKFCCWCQSHLIVMWGSDCTVQASRLNCFRATFLMAMFCGRRSTIFQICRMQSPNISHEMLSSVPPCTWRYYAK